MNILKAFKRLKPISIWKLFVLCAGNILFVVPTIRATKHCMRLSTEHYQREHYKNGPANAFRHALWNVLIARACLTWNQNEQQAMQWAKEITDWHEGAFPNQELAKKMDLHNNETGRTLFLKTQEKSLSEVVQELNKMTESSQFVDINTDLSPFKNQLVHIV